MKYGEFVLIFWTENGVQSTEPFEKAEVKQTPSVFGNSL